MTINYISSASITDAGITAAINAGTTGPNFNVSGFRIGSQSTVDGAVATQGMTDVIGFVYQGSTSQLSYTIVDSDTIMWTIALDATVGNFQVGNIAICMPGNIPLCVAVYPTQTSKYMSNPPTTLGNVLYFKVLMRLANIANLLNITIIESLTASLPEVPTEVQLPDAFASPYNAYMVDNHTKLGTPTVALRLNGNWYHTGHYSSPGMNDTVLPVPPDMFDVAVPLTAMPVAAASAVVGFDPDNGSFVNMDSLSSGLFCLGVRVAPHQIVTKGFIQVDPAYFGTLTTGQVYYADSGVNAGKLTTTQNAHPIGLAIYSNYIWVDLEAFNNVGYATYERAGITRWATQVEVNTGFSDSTGPVVKPDTLGTWVTNGSLFNLFQTVGGVASIHSISSNYSPATYNQIIQIAANAGSLNVLLPSPGGTLTTLVTGQGFRIYNASAHVQNVNTVDGYFVGPYYTVLNSTSYSIPINCFVDFISNGTNWIVIDYHRIATQTGYGISRQATMSEALSGITSNGFAPAFITPEELAAAIDAAINGSSGNAYDPYANLNVGAYLPAACLNFQPSQMSFAPTNNPTINSIHTWQVVYAHLGLSGDIINAALVDNENSLALIGGFFQNTNLGSSVTPSNIRDTRLTCDWPANCNINNSTRPTVVIPQGQWKVMRIDNTFESTGATTDTTLTAYGRLYSSLFNNTLGATVTFYNIFWLKRIL